MSGALLEVGGGDDPRCRYCENPAVGPCARCRAMVCGDCSVLTEGSVKVWAICVRCERRSGKSLASAWRRELVWILGFLLILLGVVLLLPHR